MSRCLLLSAKVVAVLHSLAGNSPRSGAWTAQNAQVGDDRHPQARLSEAGPGTYNETSRRQGLPNRAGCRVVPEPGFVFEPSSIQVGRSAMFRMKICGITNVEDARHAATAGADAIGLNFYARSPRYVSAERAKGIVDAVGPEVAKVGVFVNATVAEICDVCDRVGLDWVQLHGDEPPEFLGQLPDRQLIRALRIGPPDGASDDCLGGAAAYLRRCHEGGRLPDAVLIDARVKDEYGGTGEKANWDALAGERDWLIDRPLILAGGLTADNVSDAIHRVRPHSVDTASGVESAPGEKGHLLLERFVRAARSAFLHIDV